MGLWVARATPHRLLTASVTLLFCTTRKTDSGQRVKQRIDGKTDSGQRVKQHIDGRTDSGQRVKQHSDGKTDSGQRVKQLLNSWTYAKFPVNRGFQEIFATDHASVRYISAREQ